jgi:hypothetical protein
MHKKYYNLQGFVRRETLNNKETCIHAYALYNTPELHSQFLILPLQSQSPYFLSVSLLYQILNASPKQVLFYKALHGFLESEPTTKKVIQSKPIFSYSYVFVFFRFYSKYFFSHYVFCLWFCIFLLLRKSTWYSFSLCFFGFK